MSIPVVSITSANAYFDHRLTLTTEDISELVTLVLIGESASYDGANGPQVDEFEKSLHTSPYNVARRVLYTITGKTVEELRELDALGLDFYDEVTEVVDESDHMCNDGCDVEARENLVETTIVSLTDTVDERPWAPGDEYHAPGKDMKAVLNVPSIEVPE